MAGRISSKPLPFLSRLLFFHSIFPNQNSDLEPVSEHRSNPIKKFIFLHKLHTSEVNKYTVIPWPTAVFPRVALAALWFLLISALSDREPAAH